MAMAVYKYIACTLVGCLQPDLKARPVSFRNKQVLAHFKDPGAVGVDSEAFSLIRSFPEKTNYSFFRFQNSKPRCLSSLSY